MKAYCGSFTIEAAYIMPLVLLCICIAIETGISLHDEIKMQIEAQLESEPIDMIAYMYRKEFIKELFGELYED